MFCLRKTQSKRTQSKRQLSALEPFNETAPKTTVENNFFVFSNKMIQTATTFVRTLAPEDIGVGDFVALSSIVYQFPSYLWSADCHLLPPSKPVRIEFLPLEPGVIWQVKAVCIPFVYGRSFDDASKILDVRQCKLVRISDDFSECVWNRMKKEQRRQPKGAKKATHQVV